MALLQRVGLFEREGGVQRVKFFAARLERDLNGNSANE